VGLPFAASDTFIRYFRHAISLDECRAKFKANFYHLRRRDDEKGIKFGEMPRSNHQHPKSKMEGDYGPRVTDVLEVWFAGCHGGNFLLVLMRHAWL
jgi:Uncharacterized alpha/beta hydrolase domain (DUF2235)